MPFRQKLMFRSTGAARNYYIMGLVNNLEQQVGINKSIDFCVVTCGNQSYIEQQTSYLVGEFTAVYISSFDNTNNVLYDLLVFVTITFTTFYQLICA